MTKNLRHQVKNANKNAKEQNKKLCEVQKLSKTVINVNGKQYIDYENVIRWLIFIEASADKENFYENHIPSEAWDDETFENTIFGDIQGEMEYWMIYLNMLIEASLNPKYTLTKQAKNLLKNVEQHMDSTELFYVFKKNRHIFDTSGLTDLVKKTY